MRVEEPELQKSIPASVLSVRFNSNTCGRTRYPKENRMYESNEEPEELISDTPPSFIRRNVH